MKKPGKLIIAVLILTMAFMLTACGSFSFTASGSKLTISADASDGAESEYEAVEVGKNNIVNITSALEKGELEIEFVEAVNTKEDVDDDDDYVLFDTAATVKVSPDSSESLQLNQGEYVLEIKANGETKGDVVITVDKQ